MASLIDFIFDIPRKRQERTSILESQKAGILIGRTPPNLRPSSNYFGMKEQTFNFLDTVFPQKERSLTDKFGLTLDFPLTAATGHLSKLLAAQRKRARTNITGGLSGIFGSDIRAPRLETL